MYVHLLNWSHTETLAHATAIILLKLSVVLSSDLKSFQSTGVIQKLLHMQPVVALLETVESRALESAAIGPDVARASSSPLKLPFSAASKIVTMSESAADHAQANSESTGCTVLNTTTGLVWLFSPRRRSPTALTFLAVARPTPRRMSDIFCGGATTGLVWLVSHKYAAHLPITHSQFR